MVVAFLGLATGWSQLEIHHLQNSNKAFEQSISASDDLRDKMNEVVTTNEKEANELKALLKTEKDKAAELQSQINQTAHQADILIKDIEFKDTKIAELTKQLEEFKNNLKDDEKTASDNLAAITAKRDELQTKNAELTADLAKLNGQKLSVDNEIKKLASVQETLVDTRTEFAKKKRELTNRIHDLQDTEAAYFDANACIKSIKTEINKWRYDHEKVKSHIATYETQREIHIHRKSARTPSR